MKACCEFVTDEKSRENNITLDRNLNPVKIFNFAVSSDAAGFGPLATTIGSIARRTNTKIHVRVWCRSFIQDNFASGHLNVEFIDSKEEVTGQYPSHVNSAVFDRLRVIRDCPDWDRCLVLDYDQLVLTDLWPLYSMDLGDHLLAARMHGPGVDMDYAMRVWRNEPMPEGWEHVAKYPYFTMGPLLNLAAMREAGTWDKLMAAHAAFNADEQLALTAATGGRTLGFDKRWNLFPSVDGLGDEVPDGVIHWMGWPKPWHGDPQLWRCDLWESERVTWEHLRMGLWDKPRALEVGGADHRSSRALAERGWKVIRVGTPAADPLSAEAAAPGTDAPSTAGTEATIPEPAFPDLSTVDPATLPALLSADAPPVDLLRLGPDINPAEVLAGLSRLPHRLVLRGPRPADDLRALQQRGFRREFRIERDAWPEGGPHPKVLEYQPASDPTSLSAAEDLYLERASQGG